MEIKQNKAGTIFPACNTIKKVIKVKEYETYLDISEKPRKEIPISMQLMGTFYLKIFNLY